MKKFCLLVLSVFLLQVNSFAFAADYAFSATEFYNQGLNSYRAGAYDSAINSFNQAVQIEPAFSDAYFNIGSAYEAKKQYEKAIEAYSKVLKINPNDYDAIFELAKISFKKGSYSVALKYLSYIPSSYTDSAAVAKLKNDATYAYNVQRERINSFKTNVANPNKKVVIDKFASPTGVVVDSFGNTYVACFADNSIMKIAPGKKAVLFVKSPLISGPIGLAIDKFNNIYIANYSKNNILKVLPNGKIYLFMDKVYKPYCLFVKNEILYISEQSNNIVLKYAL